MKRTNFNRGWNFRKLNTDEEYWQEIDLPHDAMVAEGHAEDARAGAGGGYYYGGRYCYRKKFIPEAGQKKYLLAFGGIAGESHVYLNGRYLKGNFYAYNGFTADLSPYIAPGAENVVEVYVDNDRQPNSRWYTGSGIYRSVCLYTGGEVRISRRGIKISTPLVGEDVSEAEVTVAIENDGGQRTVFLKTQISGEEGIVSEQSTPFTLFEKDERARLRLYVRNTKLWSCETPALYTLKVRISGEDGSVLDEAEETFGFRTVSVDPVHGLRLNGKELKLRGACIHHDNGVIGAAEFYDAAKRRIRILKEAGFNAVRISHHPCSEEVLRVCDTLGMLVWDETFDMWEEKKTKYDYSMYFDETWKEVAAEMVAKDYNHPSVIFYSIGNEIPEVIKPEGIRLGRDISEYIRSLDHTRLVTNAINGLCAASGRIVPLLVDLGIVTKEQVKSITGDENSDSASVFQVILEAAGKGGNINDAMLALANNMGRVVEHPSVGEKLAEPLSQLDVAGYNYMKARYDVDARECPDKIVVGSETTPPDIDLLWEKVKRIPQLIGDFTWTGWDYIGEAGVGHTNYEGKSEFAVAYPGYLAYCGDIDITGYRRPMSYLREIVYGLRKVPYLSVQDPRHFSAPARCTSWAEPETVASWTWHGEEGKPVRVTVYTADEEVELILNGKSVGKKKAERNRVVFEMVYEPGMLTAVGYTGGESTLSDTLQTAGKDVHFEVTLSKERMKAQDELCFVELQFTDDKGIPSTADGVPVKIGVSENAELLGFGTGDPATEQEFDDSIRTTFRGRALAVIRGLRAGEAVITIKAGGKTIRRTIEIVS